MSKEIRAFLAKAKQMLIGDGYYEKCQNLTDGSCPVCVIDQALNLLKQQPTAGEKIKLIALLGDAKKVKERISLDYSEHTIKLACDEMMVFIEDALAMLGYRPPVEDETENPDPIPNHEYPAKAKKEG